MKKQFTILSILVSVLFSYSVLTEQAYANTNVGGIIDTDTTWTLANSPYIITDTVQIPVDVTLTIEPGVTINRPTDGDMFLIAGTIYAHGTIDNKITFDGGDNSDFFSITGSGSAFLDLKYCIVENGLKFLSSNGNRGHFYLQYSELVNLAGLSDIYHPLNSIDISYNKFINTHGFSIEISNDVKIYIKNNFFYDGHSLNDSGYSDYWNYYIRVKSQDLSEIIIKYNSFIDMNNIVLKLGFDSVNTFSAPENYWGTQDKNVIESMIYDKNDDISVENYIDYLPILTEPHPNTPTSTICTSWTYSDWSDCINEEQTRTTVLSLPAGCVGGNPVLTQTCEYTPPTCSSWTYSNWGSCANGWQTRTIASSSPSNCINGNPALSQSCQNETNNEDNTETTTQSEPKTNENNPEEISTTISDGDIIQCQNSANSSAVYIVKIVGDIKYIRHIVSLDIFNYYKHLKWGNLKQVDSLNNYSMSGWVRYNTGPNNTAGPTDKVYEINGDQTKHWINMTAEDFLSHGGSEPAIFNINQGELNLYTAGVDVMSL